MSRRPEVIEVEPGARWLVESRKVAPGAYWLVTYRLERYERPAGRGHGKRYEMRCPCPHARREECEPLADRIPCAHMRAVIEHQRAKQARPTMPVNVAAMVD